MSGIKGRGGKAKPTALKLLTGNQGHRALNLAEPEVAGGIPEPPEFLDSVALAKWHELIETCHWITLADSDTLATYCEAWGRYLTAQKESAEPVLEGKDGHRYKNPAWTAINEALRQLRSAGSELGLSPSARAGIGGGPGGGGKRDKIAEKFFG